MFRPQLIKRFAAIIQDIEIVDETLRHFVLKPPQKVSFNAGQFLTIFFERNNQKYRRQYSISSAPSQELLTITVKKVENGPGTSYLWEKHIGEELDIMIPLGVFVVKEEHKTGPLVFIGTGTGVAPLYSMVTDLIEQKYPHPISVFAGYRHTALYSQKFTSYPIQYIETFSQPKENQLKGYVQEHVKKNIDPSAHYYICGLYTMIKDVTDMLKANGIPQNQIHFERYD